MYLTASPVSMRKTIEFMGRIKFLGFLRVN
jgi:hypothetical protein